MAVGILKAAAIHEAVILLRAGIGAASRRLRLADHVVDGIAALGERQIKTSLEVLASAIFLGVNWRNLSCVSSMT